MYLPRYASPVWPIRRAVICVVQSERVIWRLARNYPKGFLSANKIVSVLSQWCCVGYHRKGYYCRLLITQNVQYAVAFADAFGGPNIRPCFIYITTTYCETWMFLQPVISLAIKHLCCSMFYLRCLSWIPPFCLFPFCQWYWLEINRLKSWPHVGFHPGEFYMRSPASACSLVPH